MRIQLEKIVGNKVKVIAKIEYVTYQYNKPIIRINHVLVNNTIRVNHCWIYVDNLSQRFNFKKNLNNNISFTCRIGTYYKYKDNKRVKDYNLINIKNIEVI